MASPVPTLDSIRQLISQEVADWNSREHGHNPVFCTSDLKIRPSVNNVLRKLPKYKLSEAVREAKDHKEDFLCCQPDEKYVREVILSSIRMFAGHP